MASKVVINISMRVKWWVSWLAMPVLKGLAVLRVPINVERAADFIVRRGIVFKAK